MQTRSQVPTDICRIADAYDARRIVTSEIEHAYVLHHGKNVFAVVRRCDSREVKVFHGPAIWEGEIRDDEPVAWLHDALGDSLLPLVEAEVRRRIAAEVLVVLQG